MGTGAFLGGTAVNGKENLQTCTLGYVFDSIRVCSLIPTTHTTKRIVLGLQATLEEEVGPQARQEEAGHRVSLEVGEGEGHQALQEVEEEGEPLA